MTLLLALILISLILSIGLNVSTLAIKELSFIRLSSDSVRAHYSAESALECAIYWLFQGTQYFSDSVETIHCNNEDIVLDDEDTWTVSLGSGDQYSSVEVQKTSADPNDRNFTLSSEGFNEDPTAGVNPALVQQELGAISIDGCEFDPQNVDANNNASPVTFISSTDLQDTLDDAYDPDWMGRDNYIEASSSNTGYQTWKVGNSSGNVRITLEVTPIESDAGNANTFGYYVSNLDDPYTSWTEIKADSAFIPIFANKSNIWGAPTLAKNEDASLDGWQSFTINASENDVIGLGIHSSSTPGNIHLDAFRSTEIALNGTAVTRVRLKIGGECIAPNGSLANGTRLILETCSSDTDQQWIEDGVYWRNAADSDQVIDRSNGDPTKVQIWEWWAGSNENQRWNVSEIGTTDRYLFENQKTPGGLCIADTGGAFVTTATCDGNAAGQQIEIEEVGEFGYQYALSFDVPEPVEADVPEYVIAFEDLTLTGSDADYNDMVVAVKIVSCISELNRH